MISLLNFQKMLMRLLSCTQSRHWAFRVQAADIICDYHRAEYAGFCAIDAGLQ
jgi:hypothetical protein